jgi:hypothetical protein
LDLRHIAELAGLASANSAQLIETRAPLPAEPLNNYWHHSRKRVQIWMQHLDRWYAVFGSQSACKKDAARQQATAALAEIFVAEMLTRVWTGVLSAADVTRSTKFATPVARNVQAWHDSARNAALALMLNGPSLSTENLYTVDRVRRRAERWTDVLVGHLIVRYGFDDLAFDSRRAREFGALLAAGSGRASHDAAWQLTLAGLRLSFHSAGAALPATSAHNQGVAESVLATFPASAFSQHGTLESTRRLWAARSLVLIEGPPNHLRGPVHAEDRS